MFRSKMLRILALVLALGLFAAACGDDSESSDSASEETSAPADDTTAPDDTMSEDTTPVDSSTICEPDALVEAVESGPEDGTLAGMADDPVGTAASSNPVLTTLVSAVTAADLVDTLNSAEELTVFAPTDCAFAELDPATLEAALADPTGLLTTVLGFHVIPQRLAAADLTDGMELETFTGETLVVAVDGDTVSLNDGGATVQVADIETANATVHLIDSVMIPPSVG